RRGLRRPDLQAASAVRYLGLAACGPAARPPSRACPACCALPPSLAGRLRAHHGAAVEPPKAVSDAGRRPVLLKPSRVLEPERILRLEDDRVVFLDQRKLPAEQVDVSCRTAADVAEAIRAMVVRGAPAIGIAAAYGIALAAVRGEDLDEADAVLRASRPTAVNLAWALDQLQADPSAEHARAIHRDEVERCRAMAAHAASLLSPGTRALTHCNAGGLATGGYGSAVGALLAAWERDLLVHVWVDETRPLLQGARLTAWEL